MPFTFSKRSLDNLAGVHPDLVKVVTTALEITPIDFGVIEGRRTPERQHQLYLSGKSQLDYPGPEGQPIGRHLTGHAVDFMAYVNGGGSFKESLYPPIAAAMKKAAHDLGVPVVWGGDWTHFKDSDHLELDRVAYPDKPELIA